MYIKHKSMSPMAFGQAMLIDDDQILIVGGKQNIVSLTKTYLYSISSDRLAPFPGGQLIDSDYFRGSAQWGVVNEQLFAMGVQYIHCYSQREGRWITASDAYVRQ
ncbi:hypothetical protein FGO68_gene3347 [Halteria grandinella]|uniref:Uncharacterized protein n=1 Tax=Halteria grandinella TaxID=5974 RepID=A0A8J8NRE0_HALGN|nr:hypothetical protein FGO68_gene3347 [Halteria grandinella]